jgi:hypothetical protein
VVHAFKTLRQYLLEKLFELHTENASLQHHQALWLKLLAELNGT